MFSPPGPSCVISYWVSAKISLTPHSQHFQKLRRESGGGAIKYVSS